MLDELNAVPASRIAGVVLDVSHRNTGRVSRISAAKKSLNEEFVRHWGREDLIYIATGKDRDRLPTSKSEGLAWLADFFPSVNMDAAFLLKHTTQMVSGSDREDKVVVYVTDRFSPKYVSQMAELFRVSEQKCSGVAFCVVCLGGMNYPTLAALAAGHEYVNLFSTDDPFEVGRVIGQFAKPMENYDGSNEEGVQDQAAEPESVRATEGGHPDPVPRGVRPGDEVGGVDHVCGQEQPVPDHAD